MSAYNSTLGMCMRPGSIPSLRDSAAWITQESSAALDLMHKEALSRCLKEAGYQMPHANPESPKRVYFDDDSAFYELPTAALPLSQGKCTLCKNDLQGIPGPDHVACRPCDVCERPAKGYRRVRLITSGDPFVFPKRVPIDCGCVAKINEKDFVDYCTKTILYELKFLVNTRDITAFIVRANKRFDLEACITKVQEQVAVMNNIFANEPSVCQEHKKPYIQIMRLFESMKNTYA